jgi:orotate phosphoribosyltransferase-like protein
MNDGLKHYGTPRHSGRYPWGSGDDPQRSRSFLQQVEELKKKGLSEVDIAKGLGMTTSQLRNRKSLANNEVLKDNMAQAVRLKDKGYSNVAIGDRMGVNESTVRSWLNPALHERSEVTNTTATILRDSVEKKGYIDIGIGIERHMGVSRTKLNTAIEKLQEEGYLITYMKVEQLGTGKNTSIKVISKPKDEDTIDIVKLKNKGLSEGEIAKELKMDESKVASLLKEAYADVYANKDNIKMVTDY